MYIQSAFVSLLAGAGASIWKDFATQAPLQQPDSAQKQIPHQDIASADSAAAAHTAPTLPSTPLLNLHRNLVQIESTTGDEAEVGHFLVDYLKSLNLTVETQEVPRESSSFPSSSSCSSCSSEDVASPEDVACSEDATSSSSSPSSHHHKPRFNIHAYPPTSHGHTRAIFTSHIDTVPPFINYTLHRAPSSHHNNTPTSQTHHNNTATLRIHGRGTNDDKGPLSAQITAFHNLLSSNRIQPADASLLFVVGEETGGDGMRAASDHLHLNPDVVIFGEPTESKLVSGHKGLLQFDLHVRGVAAHSGYPWLGVSANEVLVQALAAVNALQYLDEDKGGLPRSKKYGRTTVNLGLIKGGVASNVVAESAIAKVAVRLAGGPVEGAKAVIIKAVEKATHDLLEDGKGSLEVVWTAEGYPPVDIDADVEGFERSTVNYGTDVPNFRGKKGMKRYLYGPGSILTAHGPGEFVSVGDLERAVGDYERILLSALEKV